MEEQDIVTQTHAKILVVDDKESARSLLRRRLMMYGHEVYTAEECDEAIEELRLHPVDVILLNMFVAGVSSYDFLVKLKDENSEYRQIPVIVLSSDSDVELTVKCVEAGAEDYLVKPLNQTLLKARLANCIAKKIAHDREVEFLRQIAEGRKKLVAQEKMASLGKVVAAVSNELKKPLNFIINFAQVSADQCNEIEDQFDKWKDQIQETMYKNIKEQLNMFKDNVAKISEYSRSADRIIRFMLDQSNTSNGQKTPADINKIIQQTISMFYSSCKAKGILSFPQIETNFDEQIPHINVSIQSISQVIHNLLNNALHSVMQKYDQNEDRQIKVSTKITDGRTQIIVYDNGTGIPADIVDSIFNPFFTTKSEAEGVGLGLSSSKETIEEHGGTISVVSEPGQYAEFIITL